MDGKKRFHIKPHIVFGEDALSTLKEYRGNRIGVITDEFMVSSGMLDTVLRYVAGSEIVIFSGVLPDPTDTVVMQGTKRIAPLRPQVLLAVGGGSTIDAAKAILASLREIEESFAITLVAIPTTSGTGSEATEFAVISDSSDGTKFPLRSESLTPDVAILEPELVKSVPPHVTADTGMDVITHCIEAYVSILATDFTDAFVEKALSLACKWLPRAYENGSCLVAREKMHTASCMAGLAFNLAGLGVNHGIAHAVGSAMKISHGRINAMLLPHVIEFNAGILHGFSPEECNEQVAKRYCILSHRIDGEALDLRGGVLKLVARVRELNKMLGIPATLSELGADLDVFERKRSKIIQAALDDITTTCNQRQPCAQDIDDILERVKW